MVWDGEGENHLPGIEYSVNKFYWSQHTYHVTNQYNKIDIFTSLKTSNHTLNSLFIYQNF
jgi:hypothetical protein